MSRSASASSAGSTARPRPGGARRRMGPDRRMRRWWRHWVLLLATLVSPDAGSVAAAAAEQADAPDAPVAPAEALPRQQVLRRVLRSDPLQQYLLYVPARISPGLPVFVTVHGISRNVDEHAMLFAPLAESR